MAAFVIPLTRASWYSFTFAEVEDPTVTQGGNVWTQNGQDLMLASLGAGLAYYFPINFYVAGSLLATQWELDESNTQVAESKFGLGLGALLGQEWWVSDNWGLGIAGQLTVASMKDRSSQKWDALSFAVLFSSTYN